MPRADVGNTDTSELRAIRDWGNHSGWLEFQKRYDPHLRRCCMRLGLEGAAADDVCQETWIEVAKRMQSFVYDPRRTFRGWLWKICHHEAIDLLEQRAQKVRVRVGRGRRTPPARSAVVRSGKSTDEESPGRRAGDGEANAVLADLFRMAEEVQAEIRRRVEPHTWEAFWSSGLRSGPLKRLPGISR